MMKSLLLAAATIVLLSSAASADPFAAAYGNTLTTIGSDNSKAMMYVNPDGTWERHKDGEVIKGTFAWKDPQTACFTVTDPAPKQGEQPGFCRAFTATHAVGDTWTETDSAGKVYTITLTAGR